MFAIATIVTNSSSHRLSSLAKNKFPRCFVYFKNNTTNIAPTCAGSITKQSVADVGASMSNHLALATFGLVFGKGLHTPLADIVDKI